jgi:hypothetical protein
LVDVLLGAVVIGAEIAVQSYEADQKATKEREAREQRERQNQPRQQQVVQPSQVQTNQQQTPCKYAFCVNSETPGEIKVSNVFTVPIDRKNTSFQKTLEGPYTPIYQDYKIYFFPSRENAKDAMENKYYDLLAEHGKRVKKTIYNDECR